MGDSDNGNGKVELGKILQKLDSHGEILTEIKTTLLEIGKITTMHEVQITLSKSDINNLGIKIDKHEESHKYNTGIILTVSSLFGGVIAWVVGYFRR
ncbi:MAG: hypothetical protein PHH73_00080 [Candidatus Rickettsiella isopodorum]|nr:hypothetical protein [Candidatus Rickettsiella isopodorum]